MNKSQRNNVKKAELERIIDSDIAVINNDPNELRNVITNTINIEMDKKFEQFTRDFTIRKQKGFLMTTLFCARWYLSSKNI